MRTDRKRMYCPICDKEVNTYEETEECPKSDIEGSPGDFTATICIQCNEILYVDSW